MELLLLCSVEQEGNRVDLFIVLRKTIWQREKVLLEDGKKTEQIVTLPAKHIYIYIHILCINNDRRGGLQPRLRKSDRAES